MSGETTFVRPDKEIVAEIPSPTMYRIVVRPLEPKKKTEAGIQFTDEIQRNQQYLTVVGQIVAVGPTAFQQERFKGSECVVGDWVLYSTGGGTRVELSDGRVFQIMNDDEVTAKIEDPELYRKKVV